MLQRLFGLTRSDKSETDDNRHGIDTDCNYCPKCEEEYRAEIETCAACSIRLMPGAEKLALLRRQEAVSHPSSMEISADDELVDLQTGKLIELKQLRHLLEKQHIPSILAGEGITKG